MRSARLVALPLSPVARPLSLAARPLALAARPLTLAALSLALAALSLALGACTAEPASAPVPAPVATPAEVQTNAGSGDPHLDRFVAAVQEKLPDVAMDRRDEEVAALGQTVCDGLASGGSPAAVARSLSDEGVTAGEAKTLLTLATSTACTT